jgi:predicted DNA-binding transcriptional regulator AlpA
MSTGIPEATTAAYTSGGTDIVFISKWVNEGFPPWHEILTARDLACLTRRHRWELCALTLIRRFPKQRRFRGRKIGWLRSDVLDWMDGGIGVRRAPDVKPCRRRILKDSRQGCLPLDSASSWAPPRSCARLSVGSAADAMGRRS